MADADALWAETRSRSALVWCRLRVSMPVLLGRFGISVLAARFV